MQAYLATICRDLVSETFCVGGIAIHIVTLSPKPMSGIDERPAGLSGAFSARPIEFLG
jgi:hypothetical protein